MYFPTTAMHLGADDMRRLEQGEGIERAVLLDRQAGGSRWLRRPGCWLLCLAGRLLVALGERLTRAGMAQALPLERAVGSR